MNPLLVAGQHGIENDLKQEKKFVLNILKQILNSRRLLIDHVECLESILYEVEQGVSNTEIFTLRNTSIIGSLVILLNATGSISKSIRYGGTLVASSFGVMYLYKCMKNMRNARTQRRIETLIQSLRSFGNSIKKNISYFNESLFIKGEKIINEDVHYKRAWDCIQSIKTVTEILFYATRHLEENYHISSNLADIYAPIEDLNTCHYFSRPLIEFSSQHIKDFYNIFAYMQSQFLLRLALSVAENSHINYFDNDLPTLIIQIKKVLQEEENSFMKIAFTLKERRLEERSKLRESFISKNHYTPLAILKDISLKLTSSIVAVAEEFEKLDHSLQNIVDESEGLSNSDQPHELVDMADTLGAIEHCLSTCNDDFQRLMLIYKKYVLKQMNLSAGIDESMVDYDNNGENQRSEELANVNHEIGIPVGDDYFAYLYDDRVVDEDEQKDFDKYVDYELYNLDHKVTKKRFKPVLKQLMDKIDPIREDALKTERKILEAKGIDVNKFDCREAVKNMQLDDGGDDSDDGEAKQKRGPPTRFDQYSDVREFLAGKAPTNLFILSQPPRGMCEEDIIE